jgi:glycosyltransferase involved in cell wall biosynthesis
MSSSDAREPRYASDLPPASLIICSRNRPKLLLETLESIFEGEEVPAELVIIDQSDRSNPLAADFKIKPGCRLRYLWVASRGLCRAMNEAVRTATTDILVFTHDDVRVSQHWFGIIVRELVNGGPRVVITGRVLPGDAEISGGFVPNISVEESDTVYQGRVWSDVLYPLNMAMFRETLSVVGSFEERLGPGTPFPGAEDNDFAFRLLEAGYRIKHVTTACVYHRAWRPPRDYVQMRWAYGRAQGAFYAKHRGAKDRYVRRRFLGEVKHRCRRLLQRSPKDFRLALGDMMYVLGLFSGAAEWLRRYWRPWMRTQRPDAAAVRAS